MSETMEQSNSKVTSLQTNAVSINASKVMSLGGEEVTDTVIILSEKRSNDVCPIIYIWGELSQQWKIQRLDMFPHICILGGESDTCIFLLSI